ncbi:MAG: DNA polymerase III subunit delta [Paludibacteraceae bacterium]|nr:DNA polymerase III subunit delta [Paludibacteraceae bacterium]
MAKVAIDYRTILSEISEKKFKPVYFLQGEEPYYIDLISNYMIEHVLEEEQRDFNQNVVYGQDVDVRKVIDLARSFPMGAPNRLVVVKEAQKMPSVDDLSLYLQKPMPSSIIVFCFKGKKLDARKKITKDLEKEKALFTFEKLYDNQVPDFVESYLKERGMSVEPKAKLMIAEHLGNDLQKVANEIDKLLVSKPADCKSISCDLVERNIGISKDFNAFELVNALFARNVQRCNLISLQMAKSKSFSIIPTITTIFSSFSNLMVYHYMPNIPGTNYKNDKDVAAELKINPFFVKQYASAAMNFKPKKTMEIISLLRTYDAMAKGVGNISANDGELLKELIFKILH